MTNNLLLDALHCKNEGPVPVWLMRQAGRWLPEYRALRTKYTFLEMCHQPELIAQVTQLPIHDFGMDAAILFSDILVIPEALGLGLRFEENVGPIFEHPLSTAADVDNLPKANMREKLQYVTDGIRLLKPELKVPLIGFCGAPFTMASYMIEGKSGPDLHKTKRWMLRDPSSFHRLLQRLADCAIEYLEMQIEAGVQAVQIFDTWAGRLAYEQFREFSLFYFDKILRHVKSKVPVILYSKGTAAYLPDIAKINPNALSLDWNAHLTTVRRMLPPTIAIQGNLDPDILYAPLNVVRKETYRILEEMDGHPGFIFNLGHGLAPDTPIDAVRALVDCVHSER